MAFNRLSTVACPFSPKCILSKGFFFGFFFGFSLHWFWRERMENFGSAIFGLAKLKKKVTQETTERKKKKMRMMVCLVELFSQCTFMYKTTTSRIISFLALKHVRTQWITKWSKYSPIWGICTKPPATCLLLAEAETKFFEKRTERSNI